MKVMANDLGVCGVEQLLFAGSVKFDSKNASEGVELCKLPVNAIITRAVANVTTAFDDSTSNKVSVGTDNAVSNLLADTDITTGTAGAYSKLTFVEAAKDTVIKAKFVGGGSSATAGEAEIYIFAVGIPE